MNKKNYKGVKAWFLPEKMANFERWLFSLHRITGIILILYLIVHVFVVGSRAFGKESWINTMQLVGAIGEGTYRNIVKTLEYFLILVVGFHALNGLRLIITEFGFLLGKPKRPEYPYVASSLKTQRVFIYFLMILFFTYLLLGFQEFFLLK